MGIIFEGSAPFYLPVVQSASASVFDETVELTLNVIAPGQGPSPVPILVQMTAKVAKTLFAQLEPAITMAEERARKGL